MGARALALHADLIPDTSDFCPQIKTMESGEESIDLDDRTDSMCVL